jgi:hypothetical protein
MSGRVHEGKLFVVMSVVTIAYCYAWNMIGVEILLSGVLLVVITLVATAMIFT